MNPMIRKELRQRMRERRAWILPSLYLLVLGGTVTFAYFTSFEGSGFREVQGAEVGTTVFVVAAFAQLAILLLITPVFSAGAVTIEKEQRTLAGLLTSLLTTPEIWWGKFVAALLFQVLLLVSAVPVLALAFAFGGVGWRELGIATLATLRVVVCFSVVGLACSAYFRRTIHATAVTYAVLGALTALTAIASLLLSGRGDRPVLAPLYLNPFFTMMVGLFDDGRWRVTGAWPSVVQWGISLGAFLVLAAAAAIAAIAFLRQGGEQV